jgi:hypothetical protein
VSDQPRLDPSESGAAPSGSLDELAAFLVEESGRLASGPDYLGPQDLAALGLAGDEVRGVLGQAAQIHRDELADRLLLYRQEERSRRLS